MRLLFGLVLVAGIGLAGFAVMMAQNYINAYQAELQRTKAQNIETVDIFVAADTMKYGAILTDKSVRQVKWPKEAVPAGAFTSLDELLPEGNEEPRTVLRTMERFEPILAVKVTEPGEDGGLISRLEKGMRAFTIRVDVASGVSGFLRPGDRVDVYWTGRGPSVDNRPTAGEVTKLIHSSVPLIAVDQTASDETTGATIARTVTVSVTPQQAAALAQAQSTGDLSLALVGADDESIAEVVEVDQRSLLGIIVDPEPVIEKEEDKCTVRTRRGSEVMEIEIPCTN